MKRTREKQTGGRKYMKRGDIEKARVAEYHVQANKRIKATDNVIKDTTTIVLSVVPSDDKAIHLTQPEVFKRLRSRDEPVTLFAESDYERYKRLLMLEGAEVRPNSQTNEFKRTLASARAETTESILSKSAGILLPPTSLDDDIDTTIISSSLLKIEPEKVRQLIPIFFKRILTLWQGALASRPDSERDTPSGRILTATHLQSSKNLVPFFRLLSQNKVDPDVLLRTTEICDFIQQREYQLANDAYIKMSIGNAPWPIGVTAVGIHERSSRDKIFTSQVGHVLNDETQRKWIQSIKRLITFSQRIWPPDDLSRAVG